MRMHEGETQAESKLNEKVDNRCAVKGSHHSYQPTSRQLWGEDEHTSRLCERVRKARSVACVKHQFWADWVLNHCQSSSLSSTEKHRVYQSSCLKSNFACRSHSSLWQLLDSCTLIDWLSCLVTCLPVCLPVPCLSACLPAECTTVYGSFTKQQTKSCKMYLAFFVWYLDFEEDNWTVFPRVGEIQRLIVRYSRINTSCRWQLSDCDGLTTCDYLLLLEWLFI